MKKIIILSTFLALNAILLNAQESQSAISKSGHEISIVTEDIFAKTSYDYYGLSSTTSVVDVSDQVGPKVGIGYKYIFNGSAIRSRILLSTNKSSYDNESSSRKNESSSNSGTIMVGYEFHKNYSKTQLFYGADLHYSFSKTKSKNTNYGGTEDFVSENINSYTAYGISPLVGVAYFISPTISVSTEIKFTAEPNKTKTESKYTGSEDTCTETKGFNTRFGPLGQLSINIHF